MRYPISCFVLIFPSFRSWLIAETSIWPNNKAEHTKKHLRQLGHLTAKTRRFPSPPHGGFGFIRIALFFIPILLNINHVKI